MADWYSELLERFGPAAHPERPVAKERPAGASDELVAALGKLSEALEVVEEARGLLYTFHRRSGTADRILQDAVQAFHDAGEPETARQVADLLVGRDVIPGFWTFQIVEGYDTQYWQPFQAVEAAVRERLGDGTAHIYEAEMKHGEQQPGQG
ncbi:hypothetical protein [Jatrophihabitans sp.]|uniref:hypothetical protein n=1 Tax=Jatrophihabitans sp. TaxID=1932789 RepID=UPI002C100C3A|nr:hypothetical protein [Jatrophihabitans sp.]